MLKYIRDSKTIKDNRGTNRVYHIYLCPICEEEVEKRSDNAYKSNTCGKEECKKIYFINNNNRVNTTNSKAIAQLELNRDRVLFKYSSVGLASTSTNIPRSNIIKCAKGIRKSAGGYRWKYL